MDEIEYRPGPVTRGPKSKLVVWSRGVGRSAIGGERARKKAALVIRVEVGEVGPEPSMLMATGIRCNGGEKDKF